MFLAPSLYSLCRDFVSLMFPVCYRCDCYLLVVVCGWWWCDCAFFWFIFLLYEVRAFESCRSLDPCEQRIVCGRFWLLRPTMDSDPWICVAFSLQVAIVVSSVSSGCFFFVINGIGCCDDGGEKSWVKPDWCYWKMVGFEQQTLWACHRCWLRGILGVSIPHDDVDYQICDVVDNHIYNVVWWSDMWYYVTKQICDVVWWIGYVMLYVGWICDVWWIMFVNVVIDGLVIIIPFIETIVDELIHMLYLYFWQFFMLGCDE